MRKKIAIAGAGGRDFHNFNLLFRDNEQFEVVAFTATQIPNIANRTYPPELAGQLYPQGGPILPEAALPSLIREQGVEEVVFSYSDVSHEQVMRLASQVLASGASFRLVSPQETMLQARVPVIAVCAVRSGAGKSPASRAIVRILRGWGHRVVIVRHPMPYGDLSASVCQRFGSFDDLDKHHCTIEEREEHEPHLEQGNVVYAGVDYGVILEQSQQEADIIVWDGGNNDTSFFHPDMLLVVTDPLRAGDELRYHPGETNLRMADVVLINKVNAATRDQIALVEENVRQVNPSAPILRAASPVTVDLPDRITGKRVLVIEDGPTTTHGGVATGAGYLAATSGGAAAIIDPRPYAVGSLAETYRLYQAIGPVLPAVGYSDAQLSDLRATIEATPCDVVVIATPIDLRRLISFQKPSVRVTYTLEVQGRPTLEEVLAPFKQ